MYFIHASRTYSLSAKKETNVCDVYENYSQHMDPCDACVCVCVRISHACVLGNRNERWEKTKRERETETESLCAYAHTYTNACTHPSVCISSLCSAVVRMFFCYPFYTSLECRCVHVIVKNLFC